MIQTTKTLFEIGKVLDNKWVIVEFIGKGAMGEVYRAHQVNLKRDVAIKVISAEVLEELDDDSEGIDEIYGRFRREVQAMAKVRHVNILNIHDYGSLDTEIGSGEKAIEYIAMEYIPGNTLRFTMSDQGLDDEPGMYADWIKTYFMPILDGVEIMHSHNIVHRDLKPENIFIDGTTPKIADFGLARSSTMTAVTSSITMLGTLAYMSSEQCSDFKKSDYTADIYALGKILFEVADGRLTQKTVPFKVVSLTNTDTPFFREISLVIEKATADDKDDRYQSVTELRNDLEKALGFFEDTGSTAGKGKAVARDYRQVPWRQLLIFAAIGLLLVVVWNVWHSMGEPGFKGGEKSIHKSVSKKKSEMPSVARLDKISDPIVVDETPKLEHLGKQDFVAGGQLVLPVAFTVKAGETVEIKSFSIDQNLVTNQQYIDFLNHYIDRISIENGIVKGDGVIWYLMGEVRAGYEPIVYRGKKFHISDPSYTSTPVLRVTGYGAAAFAKFMDRRLPSEVELLYAKVVTGNTPQLSRQNSGSAPDTMQMNDGMEMGNWGWGKERWNMNREWNRQNASWNRSLTVVTSEWGVRTISTNGKDTVEKSPYLVMGAMAGQAETTNVFPKIISRFPWEGFEEVGFRTVGSYSP